MDVGIAYDLKSDFPKAARTDGATEPSDRYEEYDSEETVDAIAGALRAAGHEPRKLGGGRQFLTQVLARPPQLVFNIAEGRETRSREAQVPAACEMLGIPYTHSDPLTLALSLDKAMCKRVVQAQGVPTPAYTVVSEPEQLATVDLRFPVIAKPLFEGSSMGIRKSSRLTAMPALRAHLEWLLRDYRQPVLVEEFCPGPEFTVGVLGSGAEARVVGIMEIRPKRDRPEEFVYSLEAKRNYQEEVDYQVPPQRPAALLEEVRQTALRAFRALDCRDVSRVDLRLGVDGRPQFLEINPLPGLSPVTGDLPILAARSGLPYPQLIEGIVASARRRFGI